MTPSGRVRKPTIPEVCQWVINSWNGVKDEIVVKSFKKCGISNNLDETEDDAIYEDEEDNSDHDVINNLAAKVEDCNLSYDEDEAFHGFYDD